MVEWLAIWTSDPFVRISNLGLAGTYLLGAYCLPLTQSKKDSMFVSLKMPEKYNK